VTIEDLIEEIVGSIKDEHEEDEAEPVTREGDGSWVVPGNLDVERLGELLNDGADLPEDSDSTTVGGLVSEAAGRIPQTGEVIERYGIRFEILAASDRRIERVRVGPAAIAEEGA
jgi:CBS domain containing-hemolysin-like protein